MSVALWFAGDAAAGLDEADDRVLLGLVPQRPGTGAAQDAEVLRSRIASYLARLASVKMRGFLLALSQLSAPPPLSSQSSQSTA